MSLSTGARLGPYEILGPLGAGGMGKVYRAHDTRLGRDVAIKVLSERLSASPEVRARFEREARTISQLNHPHICTLHDIGHQEGVDYLVMELLEGETLAHRLEKGPLPLPEVLRYGAEIAEALDVAHRSGIVHRDLKPANVMLTKRGAKLMDFGLARAPGFAPGAGTLTESPTVSRPLTAEGTIIGTFQYMAPEQLEGKEADHRTDIFAFGAVLYEMLTGTKAFGGTSHASLIANIIHVNPPAITSVQPAAPPGLERILTKCLAKNPDDRWQSARDLTDALRWTSDPDERHAAAKPAQRLRWREAAAWVMCTVAVILACVMGLSRPPQPTASPGPMKLSMLLPQADDSWGLGFSISPNGRRLAYTGEQSGRTKLWLRDMDSLSARPLNGTDDAVAAFWAPDSRRLAFFTPDKLKTIDTDGGQLQSIGDVEAGGGGGAWNVDDTILFNPSARGPLLRVSATGGAVTPVTVLDSAHKHFAHVNPQFLPDGQHFIYFALSENTPDSGIFVGSLDSASQELLVRTTDPTIFVEPGVLLSLRDGVLLAQGFDLGAMAVKGAPFPLAQGSDIANFDASKTGVLVYSGSNIGAETQAVWFNREGKELERIGEPGPNLIVNLSPDEKRIAVTRADPETKALRNWIRDLARNVDSLLREVPGNFNTDPQWSPDGAHILFTGRPKGCSGLFRMDLNRGQVEEIPLPFSEAMYASDWSRDGKYALTQNSGGRMYAIPLSGDRKPLPLVEARRLVDQERFSPDVQWIAYNANDSGRFEVFVMPFLHPGPTIQVSNNGGMQPRWRRDGKELFYLDYEGRIMSVAVQAGNPPTFGAPRPLFKTRLALTASIEQYDVTADGQRFVMLVPTHDPPPATLTVALNWQNAARR